MDLSAHLEKIIASLKKDCELALRYNSSANLDEYLGMAAEIAEIDLDNAEVKNAIELAGEAETEEEFDNIFRAHTVANFDTETVKRHRIYKDFERFTRDLLSKRLLTSDQTVTQTTVTNDMEITEQSHAVDPITKGPLIRPVRNKHCNHVYGYQSVIDSLAINRRLRCPMIGCSNKQYIVQEDLVELPV